MDNVHHLHADPPCDSSKSFSAPIPVPRDETKEKSKERERMIDVPKCCCSLMVSCCVSRGFRGANEGRGVFVDDFSRESIVRGVME